MAAGKQEQSCCVLQYRTHRALGLPALSASCRHVHLLRVSRAGLRLALDSPYTRTFPARRVCPRAATVRASLDNLMNKEEERTSENAVEATFTEFILSTVPCSRHERVTASPAPAPS